MHITKYFLPVMSLSAARHFSSAAQAMEIRKFDNMGFDERLPESKGSWLSRCPEARGGLGVREIAPAFAEASLLAWLREQAP